MKRLLLFCLLLVLAFSSCREARIKDRKEWSEHFNKYGIKDGCFIIRDHTHEAVDYYNKERCLQRFSPASTFKIFNSLVALETTKAQDETLIIPWDSVKRRPEVDMDMNMKDAFRLSNLGYYQELARRIGMQNFKHYLDTVRYGNMETGTAVDSFWLNNTLQISADEQVGFLKKLYFEELPFTTRSQTIVRSLMLRSDSAGNKLYYKTGWGYNKNNTEILWVVGFIIHKENVKEDAKSMNKSDERNYPYFFALNFDIPKDDKSKDWMNVRLQLLDALLKDYGVYKKH